MCERLYIAAMLVTHLWPHTVQQPQLTLYTHIKTTATDRYTAMWLWVHWPLLDGLLRLVQ